MDLTRKRVTTTEAPWVRYTLIASGYPPVAAALTVGDTAPEAFGLTLSHPDD